MEWQDSHVVARLDPTLPSACDRESQHRKVLGDNLEGVVRGDDIVMISDADELRGAQWIPPIVERSR